jgi:hypothetical protein
MVVVLPLLEVAIAHLPLELILSTSLLALGVFSGVSETVSQALELVQHCRH